MCGSLRREELDKKVGHPVWIKPGRFFPVETPKGKVMVLFNGHARSENLDQWLKKGWKEGVLPVDQYTEGRGEKETVFDVPKGYGLKIVYKKIGTVGKDLKYIYNIVTREAKGKEKEVHNRFPVLARKGEMK